MMSFFRSAFARTAREAKAVVSNIIVCLMGSLTTNAHHFLVCVMSIDGVGGSKIGNQEWKDVDTFGRQFPGRSHNTLAGGHDSRIFQDLNAAELGLK